jgi:predicted dienelactone hydrolase
MPQQAGARIVARALFVIGAIGCALADGPAQLPHPTGPFGIGRVTLVCIDNSRVEPLDPNRSPRRIVVDVWYPADQVEPTESRRAKYLAVEEIERAIGPEGLKKQLGRSYGAVKAGVLTRALVEAPFAKPVRSSPVLIFSPGGGMIRELYSSQLQDLASHGYVVAALTHTYDGFLTVFPDGSHVAFDGKRWPATPSIEGEVNLNQLEWHTDDMRIVLDELNGAASGLPFAGRLDFTRVGAFGHSFGGIAAAHACQTDQRIKACLNQDGAVASQPYFLDVRRWGMDQPFMLIERAPRTEPPSDQELAAMNLTRERLNEILKRLDTRRDRALRATGKGAYLVVLQRQGTSHMDFSDLQILGAATAEESEARRQFLAAVSRYTRAFFDRHLRGVRSAFLEASPTDAFVEEVRRFAPATLRGAQGHDK